jgi:hypothetical protein
VAERAKPRMRGHKISQNMLKAMKRASRMLVRMVMIIFLSGVFLP